MKSEQFNWTELEKLTLRFFICFFALLIIPIDINFISSLSHFKTGTDLYALIFSIINYVSSFFSGKQTIQLLDIIYLAVIAIGLAIIWNFVFRKEADYNKYYQWIRVVLRYKLSAVLFSYALIKIFALQIPYPTLSQLNTPYGDFTPSKIVELTMGIAKANYQQAIGFAELTAALLLLFNRTIALGALTAAGILLNVVLAAFAYQTGDQYYSLYLMFMAVFILAYDFPKLWQLMLEKPVIPNQLPNLLSTQKLKKIRKLIKFFFYFILIIYSINVYSISNKGGYAYPQLTGLDNSAGVYNVETFILNQDTIPYHLNHFKRWKNVVFEEWATLSIDFAKNTTIDSSWTQFKNLNDLDRTYESTGNARRIFYNYSINKAAKELYLKNKNKSLDTNTIVLKYEQPDINTIVLKGKISETDTLYTILKKISKTYLLKEGRRSPIKL